MTAQSTAVAPALEVRRPTKRRLAGREWLVRLGSVAAVLLAWELYAPHVPRIFLRPPSDVARAFVELVRDGSLWVALTQSLRQLAAGLALAIVIGILFGIFSARSWFVFNAANPWVNALYATPTVTLVPFFSLWIGIGDRAKIATIALFAVFPVLINTQQGIRHVDQGLLEVARSFSSSERRLWTDVLLPSALPFILAGVRLSIGRALVGMIIAEYLISFGGGLGTLIITYQNVWRVDKMFVPVIVVAVLGIVLMGGVQWIERRVAPWARRET
jgi:NitT/TauT family transport system permease protein